MTDPSYIISSGKRPLIDLKVFKQDALHTLETVQQDTSDGTLEEHIATLLPTLPIQPTALDPTHSWTRVLDSTFNELLPPLDIPHPTALMESMLHLTQSHSGSASDLNQLDGTNEASASELSQEVNTNEVNPITTTLDPLDWQNELASHSSGNILSSAAQHQNSGRLKRKRAGKSTATKYVLIDKPIHLDDRATTWTDAMESCGLHSIKAKNRCVVPYKQRPVPLPPLPTISQTASTTTPSHHDIIITVALYHPRYTKGSRIPKRPMAEYQVLGSHSLTVLRDVFDCINDFIVFDEEQGDILYSGRTNQDVNQRHQKLSASCFFIENVFYDDVRLEGVERYSDTIIQWNKAKQEHLDRIADHSFSEVNFKVPRYSARTMSDTCFHDLSIRLDQAYLFLHQGCCEHLMVFKDVQCSFTPMTISDYPKLTFMDHRIHQPTCQLCDVNKATWITMNDRYAPCMPCLWCATCYQEFHYHQNQLVYTDFIAIPFHMSSAYSPV